MRFPPNLYVMALLLSCALSYAGDAPKTGPVEPPLAADINTLTPNKWYAIKPDFHLPTELKDATFTQGDGFSTNAYRAKTGTMILRTGVGSKAGGYDPGFYSNTLLEWDLKANAGQVLDIASWGGGSGGNGRVLESFKEHPSPSPRHTYDCLAYVESEDAIYFLGSTSYRMFTGKELSDECKAAKEINALGERSTWRFSCAEKKWTRINDAPWKIDNTAVEDHVEYWPAGGKLIYAYYNGKVFEFDLKTQKWGTEITPKNFGLMTLYEARSTWDSKRQLWIFRHGSKVCSYDPAKREYAALPDLFPAPADKKDPLNNSQSIAYDSKHDLYLTTGPTGNDTWAYSPDSGKWQNLKAGDGQLPNWAYLKYDPQTNTLVLNYQLKTYVMRYAPGE